MSNPPRALALRTRNVLRVQVLKSLDRQRAFRYRPFPLQSTR